MGCTCVFIFSDIKVSRSSVMKPLGFPITRRFEWKGRDILSKCNLLASVEENLGRMPYMFSPCQNYILQIKTVAPWSMCLSFYVS